MGYIDLDLNLFNVIKYVLVALLFTPLTEFLVSRMVNTFVKVKLVLRGSAQVSSDSAHFWGLYSHYTGKSWASKAMVLIPAIWLVATEILLEFSFDVAPRANFVEQNVWRGPQMPSWDQFLAQIQVSPLEYLDYYRSDIYDEYIWDYDLIFDGFFQCQTANFLEEQSEWGTYISITQTATWHRTYRRSDNFSISCGVPTDVEVTAKLLLDEARDEDSSFTGIRFAEGAKIVPVSEDVHQLLFKHFANHTNLVVYVVGDVPIDFSVSAARVACCPIVLSGFLKEICIHQDKQIYSLYFVYSSTYSYTERNSTQERTTKKLLELSPRAHKTDPLLNIMESILVLRMFGTFGEVDYLSARHVRELIQIYLSLDSNGGHSFLSGGEIASEKVRESVSNVIVIRGPAYIALGLWALLLMLPIVVMFVCEALATYSCTKKMQEEEDSRPEKLLTLRNLKGFCLDLGKVYSVLRQDLRGNELVWDYDGRSDGVRYQLVNVGEKGQTIDVIGSGETEARDYAKEFVGHGRRHNNRT